MGLTCHHSAICVRDFNASLRFYTEGIGLEVLMERDFEGDWPSLFGAPEPKLRSAFLGDPSVSTAGIVELVDFVGGVDDGPPPSDVPRAGFFLLSFYVDVDETLARLAALGLGGEPRRIDVPGMAGQRVPMAVV